MPSAIKSLDALIDGFNYLVDLGVKTYFLRHGDMDIHTQTPGEYWITVRNLPKPIEDELNDELHKRFKSVVVISPTRDLFQVGFHSFSASSIQEWEGEWNGEDEEENPEYTTWKHGTGAQVVDRIKRRDWQRFVDAANGKVTA